MSLNRAAKVLARTRREIQRSKTRTSAFESSRALSCGCNVRRTEDSTPDIFTAALVATAAAGTLCSASCTRENSACDAKRNFTPFQPLTSKAEPRRFKTMHQPRNVMLHRMRSAAGRGLNAKYKVDWKTVLGEGAYGSVHPARLAITGEKVSFNCDVTSASYQVLQVLVQADVHTPTHIGASNSYCESTGCVKENIQTIHQLLHLSN